MTGTKKDGNEPIVIKKYANRRLYNTATSSYVTLDHLSEMVKKGVDFNVYDAKTGEDITRSVLTQIILEEETKGTNLLPIPFLKQLIKFYGDSLQAFVPSYLETAMDGFTKNQEQFRTQLQDAFGGKLPFPQLEEIARQNMALFQRTMRMFSPFGAVREEAASAGGNGGPRPAKGESDEIADLKSQIEAMRQQLDTLAGRK